ncbi:hypothetical protein LPTSP3_g07690 [Leptospira kobayashii]|uniref:histidine kinase n=1 Tax=Leptospira kobayashii TaxID=1917830 RepID=A0ABM7UQR6_9LEPT|nr:histidine kinase N-terminal 7TM domain-containing protein [Leptospira kobayashii]BDA77839.1 hypothetical protein LPTSP3_g07690 [Leptospira kobayashii]
MWQFHPYSLLLGFAFCLNLTLGLFVLRSIQLNLVRYLLVMIAGCLLWTGFYGFDFLLIDKDWHRFRIYSIHTGVIIATLGGTLSTIGFTQDKQILTRRMWVLLSIQPLLMAAILLFDPLFGTFLKETHIEIIEGRTQWVQALALPGQIVELGGSTIWSCYIAYLILKSILNTRPPARNQFYVILLSFIVLWVTTILHIVGVRPFPGLVLAPVSLSVQVLIFFFAIGYYRMFDLVPLVRGEIVDELDDPVVILDGRNRVVDWNIVAEQLFVDGRKYLTLSSTDVFFQSYPELSQKIQNLSEKRNLIQWRWESKDPNRDWDVRVKRVRDRYRISIGLVVVFRDITDQKKIESQMVDANRSLSYANATKDRFLSIISHDLRGPLAGIKVLLKILNEKVKAEDTEMYEMTKSLVDASESVFSLLENLLEWSKLQRGQEEFHPNFTNVNDIVNETVYLFELNAKTKSIQIQTSIPTHATVFCDDRMILTVLRNFLSNAIKFSHNSSTIRIEAEEEGMMWRIRVIDTGVGISADILKKLFQVGEVIKSIGTQGENGNGIGLLLCQEFVERNQGKIRVESEIGKGSVFSFTLCKTAFPLDTSV